MGTGKAACLCPLGTAYARNKGSASTRLARRRGGVVLDALQGSSAGAAHRAGLASERHPERACHQWGGCSYSESMGQMD